MRTPRILHYPDSKWSMAEWIVICLDGVGRKATDYWNWTESDGSFVD